MWAGVPGADTTAVCQFRRARKDAIVSQNYINFVPQYGLPMLLKEFQLPASYTDLTVFHGEDKFNYSFATCGETVVSCDKVTFSQSSAGKW